MAEDGVTASRRALPPAAALPRLPVAPPRPRVEVAVVAFCALLALTGYAGQPVLALAVAFVGLVVAWGWAGLLAVPSPRGTVGVVAVGSLSAVVATVATRSEPFLRWMPAALAVSLIGAFVHQLTRRDGRPRLVESLSATITGVAIVTSGASMVPLTLVYRGADAVTVAMAGVAAAALASLLGRWCPAALRPAVVWVGVLLALVVGVLVGAATGLPLVASAVLAGASACVSVLVRMVLAPLPTMSGARSQLVSGAASVLLSGVLVYVLTRVLIA